ncbi:MAG: hypothetical protein Ct9H300mP7_3070 [Verrucomicrobiota bacterium]|nr:MAG: hypothetical protein Ct9H300mP7_3070 [Verrucomicrobiota bacterium]
MPPLQTLCGVARCADEVGICKVQGASKPLPDYRKIIAVRLRIFAIGLGCCLDLLAVLIEAGQIKHLLPQAGVRPGDISVRLSLGVSEVGSPLTNRWRWSGKTVYSSGASMGPWPSAWQSGVPLAKGNQFSFGLELSLPNDCRTLKISSNRFSLIATRRSQFEFTLGPADSFEFGRSLSAHPDKTPNGKAVDRDTVGYFVKAGSTIRLTITSCWES